MKPKKNKKLTALKNIQTISAIKGQSVSNSKFLHFFFVFWSGSELCVLLWLQLDWPIKQFPLDTIAIDGLIYVWQFQHSSPATRESSSNVYNDPITLNVLTRVREQTLFLLPRCIMLTGKQFSPSRSPRSSFFPFPFSILG